MKSLNENHIASPAGKRLSRRETLKAAAALFSLPALEAFTPRKAFAQTEQDNFVVFYMPNGRVPEFWVPSLQNGQLRFPKESSSLNAYANRLLFCKDLHNYAAKESPGAAHAMGTTTILTGNSFKAVQVLENGISIDQAIAAEIGQSSRFRSLQWSSGEPGPCDVGNSACAHTQSVSWAARNQPLAPQIRPDTAFNQLFGSNIDGLEGDAATTRRANLKSVLDTIYQRGQSISQELGAADKARLDQYFTGIRDVETRLQAVAFDCQVGGAPADFAAYPNRVDAFLDLITLALSCGQTKVISYMIEFGLSARSHPFINANGGHHDLSHFGAVGNNQYEQLRRVEEWQISKLASLITKLDSTPGRQGGSLLDETVLIGIPSMGLGNTHVHERCCPVLIGSNKVLDTRGKIADFSATENLSNLHVTLLESYGIRKNFGRSGARFGDKGNKVLTHLLRPV